MSLFCRPAVFAGLLAILCPSSAHPQDGWVIGFVVDAETGEPLPGAHVHADEMNRGAVTNLRGAFSLAVTARDDSVSLRASLLGYESMEQTVRLHPGDTLGLTLGLAPVYLRLPGVEVVGDGALEHRRRDGSMHRISRADLAIAQPMGTEQMLRRIPGVHVSDDDGISNRVNIGIRGVYPRRSDKILLLEDGVPIQPALYIAPSAYYNPPTERIDAIEVVKNGSNIRFGAGASAGLINYVTRRPTVEPSGTVQVIGGGRGYVSALGAYGGRLPGSRAGGELQALYKRGDGFRKNTAFEIFNLTGKVLLRSTRRTQVLAKANIHREDAQATYAALTPYMFDGDPRQNPFADDYLTTRRGAIDLQLRRSLGARFVLLATAYGNVFRRYWWRQSNELISAREIEPNAPEEALVRVGLNANRARLRDFAVAGLAPRLLTEWKTAGLHHSFEIGLRVHLDHFVNREIETNRPDARVRDFHAASTGDLGDPKGRKRTDDLLTAASLSLYAEDEVRVGMFRATTGIRYERYHQTRRQRYDRTLRQTVDRFEEATHDVFLGKLSLAVELESVLIYAGVYQGFQPHTTSTAFAALVDEAGFEVNERLESERSTNLEVGARFTPVADARLDVAAFRNVIDNMVAAGRDAAFVPVVTNLGQVRYQGLEAEAGWSMWPSRIGRGRLNASASLTWIDSEIRRGMIVEDGQDGSVDISGNRAPYAPEWLVDLEIIGRPVRTLTARIEWEFVAEQYADFNNTVEENPVGDVGLLPSHQTIHTSLTYDVPARGLSLLLSVHNLTNQVYRGSRLHRSSSGIFPGGFRQVNLGLRLML